MVCCAVANCRNTSTKATKSKNGITFHKFPQNKLRRQEWELAVDRGFEWHSTLHSAVCSEHFAAKDFFLTESGLRKLSIDAIPTINISPCQKPEITISQQEPIEVNPTDTKEVLKLKHRVKQLEVIAESRRRRLIVTKQVNNRLMKKVERMTRMVKNLVKIGDKNGKNGRT